MIDVILLGSSAPSVTAEESAKLARRGIWDRGIELPNEFRHADDD
jgi:hypothetical protein